MKDELRCPQCNTKHGQVNQHGNIVAKISNGGNGESRSLFFLKGEEIRVRCCSMMTVYSFDGFVMTSSSILNFEESTCNYL